MADYDVFNGDADGICALQQLRLVHPRDAVLITGVKRDIRLLQRIQAKANDRITALDISFDKNRQDVQRLLEQGAQVCYFDHHYAGAVPDHPELEAHIDTTPDIGTSYLVDGFLQGQCRAWALVGTFGDNFDATAIAMSDTLNLSPTQLEDLRELGILMNYNAYGTQLEDLHISPVELYRRIQPYENPLEFVSADETFEILQSGYREDMAKALSVDPDLDTRNHRLYILPAEPWARRVSGVFANEIAQGAKARAHAILTRLENGGYLVSVRAPLDFPEGADQLCRGFATGGGRKAAAGINFLPESDLDQFKVAFTQAFVRR